MVSKKPPFRRGSYFLLCAAALVALWGVAGGAKEDQRHKWDKKWGPLVPHNKFPKDCGLCHIAKRWDVLREDFHFDHLKETGYPLAGAHAQVACLRCHNDRFSTKEALARGCVGCHVDPHKSAFGLDCLTCHNQVSWVEPGHQGEKISRHARTRFPLTGTHAVLRCEQCHIRAQAADFRGAPLDCYSCHPSQYNSARITPASRHAANGFPTTCQYCHNTATWGPGTQMQHQYVSAIPCYTCHATDYNSTNNPPHAASGYSTTCQNCHMSYVTWLGAVGGHPPGASCRSSHQGASCTDCHAGGNTAFAACSCTKCHYPGNPGGIPSSEQCGTSPTNTLCP